MDHEGELNIDLFQDLDVGLIELFHRRQYGEMFRHIPVEEHNHQLDLLNGLLLESRSRTSIRRQRERRRMFVTVWVFGCLPLPVVRYRYISQYLLHNIGQPIVNGAVYTITLLYHFFGYALFLAFTGNYFQKQLNRILMFGNTVTFSESFILETVTYLCKDSPTLLERNKEIVRHRNDILYFLDTDESYSNMEILGTSAINWFASSIIQTCLFGTNISTCYINEETLIFQYEHVLEKHFPILSSGNSKWPLIIATTLVYNVYAIIGVLLGVCILIFVFFHIDQRILRGPFINNLAEIIRTSLKGNVF